MRKTRYIWLMLAVLCAAFLWNNFYGNPVSKFLMEKEVEHYLLSSGLARTDIADVVGEYEKGSGKYAAMVTFSNEPHMKYLYIKNSNGFQKYEW